jgi:transposase
MAQALRSRTLSVEHGSRARSRRTVVQKKSFSATEQERPEVEARRQAFWDRAVAIPRRGLIFIDESGCNTAMTPRYARAPIGQRATASRPVNRGKNVSIIGAIRLTGVVAVRAYDGAINAVKFLHWLRHNLLPNARPGDVVVMDNLSVHKDPAVLAAIAAAGLHTLFLPPYSPEFNPIELYWSIFKRALRRVEARTHHHLHWAIRTLAKHLRPDVAPLFRHCGYI